MAGGTGLGGRVFWAGFWGLVLLASVLFVYESVTYVAVREPPLGETLLNRRLWYYSHAALAVPILFIAPVQFLAGVRGAAPAVHRWLGRLFLFASLVAGTFAIWLGVTFDNEGSRVPLVLFGVVWIGFSSAAWWCARCGDYANHRKFVIRSVAIAFAFVWIRLLGRFQDQLFGFIPDDAVVDTTREYLSFILPLLVAETWLTWWPSLQATRRAAARSRARQAESAAMAE